MNVDRLKHEKFVLQEENSALKEELAVAHASEASQASRRLGQSLAIDTPNRHREKQV